MDATGTLQWQESIWGVVVLMVPIYCRSGRGGLIVVGYTQSTNGDVTNPHGDWDYWVVKMDATGNRNGKKHSGVGFDYAVSIAPTADGGALLRVLPIQQMARSITMAIWTTG